MSEIEAHKTTVLDVIAAIDAQDYDRLRELWPENAPCYMVGAPGPLDRETVVRSVSKTGRVLILHESPQTGGFGGELAAVVAESAAFDYLDAPIRRLAGRDIPIPYNRALERATVPQVEDIKDAARTLAREGR